MDNIKICLAGKSFIAIDILDFVIHNLKFDKKNIFVVSNSNHSKWEPSFTDFAESKGVRVCKLEEIYQISNIFFFSLEFDKIIKTKLFNSNNLFNIHFSYLPAYKGVYTSVHPILNGEQESGVTLHKIDDGIDTGEIIAQKKIHIDINDTCRDLYFKYLKYGTKLVKEYFKLILSGNFSSYTQSELYSTYYSKKSIDYNNLNIDLRQTSYSIHNQLRSFIFREYQLPLLGGFQIKKSKLVKEKINPNTFLVKKNKIILSGIDGFKIIAYKQ